MKISRIHEFLSAPERHEIFVRDGILSVADYNSTRVDVVVVVVVVVVSLYCNGIT